MNQGKFFVRLAALLIAFSLGIMALSGHAQVASGKRIALVIGNDAYQRVEPLKNARNDARLMSNTLKTAGFEVTLVSDLTLKALWDAIDKFKGRIQKGDEVVFYYAGHGVQINSNQLLLPIDIEAKNDAQVQREGVSLVDVQDALKDARFAMLVIDACRDNPFPKVGTRAIGGGTRGLIPPEPVTGQIIMMSAGRNQRALDSVPNGSQTNGLFTWELTQVMQTPGIEIRNALEQVKERVDDKARRVGHEQRPSLVNDLRGNFYFFGPTTVQVLPATIPVTGTPSRARTTEEIEDAYWDNVKDSRDSASFDTYLKDYPKGRYTPLAKHRIQRLNEEQLRLKAEAQVKAEAARIEAEKRAVVERQHLQAQQQQRQAELERQQSQIQSSSPVLTANQFEGCWRMDETVNYYQDGTAKPTSKRDCTVSYSAGVMTTSCAQESGLERSVFISKYTMEGGNKVAATLTSARGNAASGAPTGHYEFRLVSSNRLIVTKAAVGPIDRTSIFFNRIDAKECNSIGR